MTEIRQTAVPGRRPLYAQAKELMVNNIVSGKWKPGQMLPSEIALAAELGVSQGTVRKALNEMEAQHQVVRKQGRGTFISEHTPQHALFHFFHIINDDGVSELPTSFVISQRTQPAAKREAGLLGIQPKSPVHVVRRLRCLRGKPVILERLVLPVALFPNIKFIVGEEMSDEFYVLYQQKYKVTVARADEKLRAVAADDFDAEHLRVEKGLPLLEIARKAYDLNGHVVELRWAHCNTSDLHYYNAIE